jgi:hypothetical protein
LANRLGCKMATLAHPRLCRMPEDRAEVQRIATHFGIEPVRLADVLRVGQ